MHRITLTLLLCITSHQVLAQVLVLGAAYAQLKTGAYKTQSLNESLIGFKPDAIAPQTVYKADSNTAFLKVKARAARAVIDSNGAHWILRPMPGFDFQIEA